ncbi:MAG: glycosyltransferase family 2 protein [Armatimonadota bacterium]|nr:glycosyltransferase family 2 protein [Armatimonadota bacterium]
MRLSVIIVNWNTSSFLAECLESLATHPPSCEHEIIVVDNNSKDFDEEAFVRRFPQVHFIRSESNLGYAAANNTAIQQSRGEYILLLNPDTRVTEGALDSLIAFMDAHPDAAACGAKLIRPNGQVELSVRSFPYPFAIACEFLGLAKIFPRCRVIGRYRMRWFSYDQEAEVDQPMGSCLMLRQTAVEDVGLLDESFPIFFNEVDWLYRARMRGWKIYFTPKALVIHHGGAATSQADRRAMIRESHESLVRFYNKHFRNRLPKVVYYAIVALIRLSVFIRR